MKIIFDLMALALILSACTSAQPDKKEVAERDSTNRYVGPMNSRN